MWLAPLTGVAVPSECQHPLNRAANYPSSCSWSDPAISYHLYQKITTFAKCTFETFLNSVLILPLDIHLDCIRSGKDTTIEQTGFITEMGPLSCTSNITISFYSCHQQLLKYSSYQQHMATNKCVRGQVGRNTRWCSTELVPCHRGSPTVCSSCVLVLPKKKNICQQTPFNYVPLWHPSFFQIIYTWHCYL